MRPVPSAVRAEPNVTPMIDVLLIIFMAVGPLIEAGFKATPPTGRTLTVALVTAESPDFTGSGGKFHAK